MANHYYASGLFELAQPSFIIRVIPFQFIPNDKYFNKQFALHNTGQVINDGRFGTADADIDAPEAWEITQGSEDIIVAIIDDGVTSNHPDLPNSRQVRLPNSNSFITPPDDRDDTGYTWDLNDLSPVDGAGYGNACAGAVAATINNGIGVTGVAPNCKIMPIRIELGGYSTRQNYADAIVFAVDNGANIISCSWGIGISFHSIIYSSIEYAINNNVVVLFSASNTASHNHGIDGAVKAPANFNIPGLITVGATDRYDKQADYSPTSEPTKNKLIDVCAPSHRAFSQELFDCYKTVYPPEKLKGMYNEGGEIWTIDTPGEGGFNPFPDQSIYISCAYIPYGQNYQNPIGAGTSHLSYTGMFGGTSYAAPVVAGVAALVLSINPNLSPLQVFDIITNTADKVGGYYYNNDGWSKELGYGRVNAYAAVVAAQNSLPPDPPDCPDNITLPNTTINSGESASHQASNTIENSTTYIIEDSGTVQLKADEIILNPGFEAEEGSTFEATVDPRE